MPNAQLAAFTCDAACYNASCAARYESVVYNVGRSAIAVCTYSDVFRTMVPSVRVPMAHAQVAKDTTFNRMGEVVYIKRVHSLNAAAGRVQQH